MLFALYFLGVNNPIILLQINFNAFILIVFIRTI